MLPLLEEKRWRNQYDSSYLVQHIQHLQIEPLWYNERLEKLYKMFR